MDTHIFLRRASFHWRCSPAFLGVISENENVNELQMGVLGGTPNQWQENQVWAYEVGLYLGFPCGAG